MKSDGVKKWEYTTLKNINMSPAIGKDGTVYFGPYNEFFYALYGNSGGLMNSAWPKFGQNEYNTSLAQ